VHNLILFSTFFLFYSINSFAFTRAYSEYTPPVELDFLSEIEPDYFQEKVSFEPGFKIMAEHWHKKLKLKNGSISFLPLQLSKIPKDLNRENPWGIYGISLTDWDFLFWNMVPHDKQWFCDLFQKALDIKTTRCDLNQIEFKIYAKDDSSVPPSFRHYLTSKRDTSLKILLTFEKQKNWPQYLKDLYKKSPFILVPDPNTLIDRTLSNSKILNKEKFAKEINTLPDLYLLASPKSKARFSNKSSNSRGPLYAVFDYEPQYLELYSKPLARNSLIFADEGPEENAIFLNGPTATKKSIQIAEDYIFNQYSDYEVAIQQYFLPMQFNKRGIYLHKPIISWQKNNTVYTDTSLKGMREFLGFRSTWQKEPPYYTEVSFKMHQVYSHFKDKTLGYQTALNYKKFREFFNYRNFSEDMAFALLNPKPNISSYEDWKKTLPRSIQRELSTLINFKYSISPVTFQTTIGNVFERNYWENIYTLSEGLFDRDIQQNKNNADCAKLDASSSTDPHCSGNSLTVLAEYLKKYYEDLNLPVFYHEFNWETDFDFGWSGLEDKQRNVIAVIHGKDNRPHKEVIILADHYDTAYEGDTYKDMPGHRHAAHGADDNYSATSTLMLAAQYLKDLPLKKDIWLVHLTGEEFPADCLGARMLVQDYLDRKNIIPNSKPRIAGVYVMDMIAHHRARDFNASDNAPAVFQISPGRNADNLTRTAFLVTQKWNELVSLKSLNRKFSRKNTWKRSDKLKVELPKFLLLEPEIRPYWHFNSSVYNTDAQIFSDARIPVVLFMENYDINRVGYHDTQDTIENIDLDYGRAISAIAIESAAQMAMQ
jgi:hypothetical protein